MLSAGRVSVLLMLHPTWAGGEAVVPAAFRLCDIQLLCCAQKSRAAWHHLVQWRSSTFILRTPVRLFQATWQLLG